jgi:hypothetical protein
VAGVSELGGKRLQLPHSTPAIPSPISNFQNYSPEMNSDELDFAFWRRIWVKKALKIIVYLRLHLHCTERSAVQCPR